MKKGKEEGSEGEGSSSRRELWGTEDERRISRTLGKDKNRKRRRERLGRGGKRMNKNKGVR